MQGMRDRAERRAQAMRERVADQLEKPPGALGFGAHDFVECLVHHVVETDQLIHRGGTGRGGALPSARHGEPQRA